MKKIIRVLGVTLSLVVLASCSTNEGEEEELAGKPLTTNITNLVGNYTISAVIAPIPVDKDKDGKANYNLLEEKGDECVWDNIFGFTESNLIITDKGMICDPTASSIIMEDKYTLDIEKKTLKTYDSNGKLLITFTDVNIEYDLSGEKTINFVNYDDVLKQYLTYYLKVKK